MAWAVWRERDYLVARGLNKVIALGIVGREPEMRYTLDGKAVTCFSVTTQREWTSADGERHQSAEWFDAMIWGAQAELGSQELHKGCRVYLEGHLQTRSWTNRENRRQFRTELVVGQMIPLDQAPGDAGCHNVRLAGIGHVNKVMIIGTLGREPEMRYTPGGRPVTCFSVATRQSWVTSDGERRETLEWFNVVSWGSLAEICGQHLGQGQQVYIEGYLQTRQCAGQDNQKNYRMELVAGEMIRLDDSASMGG